MTEESGARKGTTAGGVDESGVAEVAIGDGAGVEAETADALELEADTVVAEFFEGFAGTGRTVTVLFERLVGSLAPALTVVVK